MSAPGALTSHRGRSYDEFAAEQPGRVRAIAIRQLTVAQQVLSHGHPLSRDDGRESPTFKVEGPDGYALFQQLASLRTLDTGVTHA